MKDSKGKRLIFIVIGVICLLSGLALNAISIISMTKKTSSDEIISNGNNDNENTGNENIIDNNNTGSENITDCKILDIKLVGGLITDSKGTLTFYLKKEGCENKDYTLKAYIHKKDEDSKSIPIVINKGQYENDFAYLESLSEELSLGDYYIKEIECSNCINEVPSDNVMNFSVIDLKESHIVSNLIEDSDIELPQEISNVMESALFDREFGGLAHNILKGTSQLLEHEKYEITLYSLIRKKKVEIIRKNNLPSKFKDEEGYYTGSMGNFMISFSDFNNEYKTLFNESASIDFLINSKYENAIKDSNNKMNTCPFLNEVDIEDELLLFVYYCGGISNYKYYLKTFDFKEENGLLNVYQYGGISSYEEGWTKLDGTKVEIDGISGNEDKFSTIIWTFDKDYHLISTTVKN